jgi:NAD(P)-dependent dehydrogenase (short-subunit alcohol dehydrogenase family)
VSAFDLTGKVAVITGGGGLLGVQHAVALAQIGARVVLADVDVARAEQAAADLGADRAAAVRMDVTDPVSIREAHQRLLKSHGGVHVLVNNAAIDPKVSPEGELVESSRFENFGLDDWRLQIDVGLTGAFLCSQVFGAWMAAQGGGVILNIASDLSVISPDQRLYRKDGLPEERQPVKPVTYSVIKTGLLGLTRYLATYWADRNVRVNALSPGGVYTGQPEGFVTRLSALIPLGRMADRDEYRGAVQFLCSQASGYMTGQNLVIDGGRTVW